MTITIEWYDDQQDIILWTLDGAYEVREFFDALDEVMMHVEAADHVVYSILDYTNCPGIPPNSIAVFPRIANRIQHPRVGAVSVLVGAGSAIERLTSIFSKLFNRLHYTHTLEDAAVYIRDYAAEAAEAAK